MKKDKLSQILSKLEEKNLSQMLITEPMAIYYLTGVYNNPGERLYALYINKNGKNALFMNKLFNLNVEPGVRIEWMTDTDDVVSFVIDKVDKNRSLGIDKTWSAGFLLDFMERCPDVKCVLSSDCVDFVRAKKDDREIELMEKSSEINDACMVALSEYIKEGMTEKECADYLFSKYTEHGIKELSFPSIVSFGANGADPHHEPNDTVLKRGDSIVIDIGCVYEGYCSDMTRTFFCGEATDEFKKIHNIVREANERAEALVKPGVTLADIDKAARDYIEENGYGKFFTHRLGHFIGLTDHEAGDVSAVNMNKCEVGNIFSIEPGIYIPSKLGVRVEDLVLVTEDGCKILNKVDKNYKML